MKTSGLLFLCAFAVPSLAAELVSPFAGSEEQASYKSEFARFQYATNTGDGIEKITTEGRLSSRIFTKPEAKSTYEVYKSYASELEAAGFDVVATIGENKGEAQRLSREINKGSGINAIVDRPYTCARKSRARVASRYMASSSTPGAQRCALILMLRWM